MRYPGSKVRQPILPADTRGAANPGRSRLSGGRTHWKALILLLSALPALAQGRGPRYVEPTPIDFDEHTGWQSIFDGMSLKGWDGPGDVWRAENGEIVAQSTTAKPSGSTYLIWQGGEPGDFELKAEMKLEGKGANSGIQFRATKLGEVAGQKHSKWDLRGYQADFDLQNANTGALIECCAGPHRGVPPRPDRAFRGQMTRAAVKDGERPSLLATFGNPEQLKSYINVGDWNQIHLVARGRVMTYSINGHLMSVFLDDHPSMYVDHGFLALQLEGPGDIAVHFRNLWLKSLP
jgi:hypothetical protein